MSTASSSSSSSGASSLLLEIEISPWRRWRKEGVWPTRLFAHCVVILSAVIHLLCVDSVFTIYSQKFERNCFNLATVGALQHEERSRHGGFDFDAEDFHANEFVVFNSSAARMQLIDILRSYFKLGEDAVEYLVVASENSKGFLGFPDVSYVLENGMEERHKLTSVEDLENLPRWRTPKMELAFMHNLTFLKLVLELESHNPYQFLMANDNCVLWLYKLTYTRQESAGPLFGKIEQLSQVKCRETDIGEFFELPLVWLHGWLLLASLLHLFAALERVHRGVSVLLHIKGDLEGLDQVEEFARISWGEVLTIINSWNLLSILADICVVAFACLRVATLRTSAIMVSALLENFLLGFGCALHLVTLLEYAEYSLVDYLFLQVSRVARIEIFKIIIGILPASVGFALLGTTMFGDSVSRFGDLRTSCITLFSIALGDEIWPTFMDLRLSCQDIPEWFISLYLLSFLGVHLFVVKMCIIAVVEEAFITQGLWLLGDDPSPRIYRNMRKHVRNQSASIAGRKVNTGIRLNVSNRTAEILRRRTATPPIVVSRNGSLLPKRPSTAPGSKAFPQ